MTKDLMFKLRLDAKDRERLDAVAAHYSAPAATALRILIKEKFHEIERAGGAALDEDALHAEAVRIATRSAERSGSIFPIPSRSSCGLETRGGRTYYVLRNVNGELARFKVTPSGDLRKLKD